MPVSQARGSFPVSWHGRTGGQSARAYLGTRGRRRGKAKLFADRARQSEQCTRRANESRNGDTCRVERRKRSSDGNKNTKSTRALPRTKGGGFKNVNLQT